MTNMDSRISLIITKEESYIDEVVFGLANEIVLIRGHSNLVVVVIVIRFLAKKLKPHLDATDTIVAAIYASQLPLNVFVAGTCISFLRLSMFELFLGCTCQRMQVMTTKDNSQVGMSMSQWFRIL